MPEMCTYCAAGRIVLRYSLPLQVSQAITGNTYLRCNKSEHIPTHRSGHRGQCRYTHHVFRSIHRSRRRGASSPEADGGGCCGWCHTGEDCPATFPFPRIAGAPASPGQRAASLGQQEPPSPASPSTATRSAWTVASAPRTADGCLSPSETTRNKT